MKYHLRRTKARLAKLWNNWSWLAEDNTYLYDGYVDTHNRNSRTEFDGNRGALLASAAFVCVVAVAVVSAFS